jgi:ATP-dependent DNA ligase
MMAKLTDKLPEGKQWTYEVKWDGYRALLLKSGDRVRLLSRKENDLTATYPTIEASGRRPRSSRRWSRRSDSWSGQMMVTCGMPHSWA